MRENKQSNGMIRKKRWLLTKVVFASCMNALKLQ
ncbi:hypothetical protein BT93_A0899 [Corymbia citriodora subsp. variegata]|nr:hypothetical protein BT93_A0899 [Corymbia citriodora subsp. variegata]